MRHCNVAPAPVTVPGGRIGTSKFVRWRRACISPDFEGETCKPPTCYPILKVKPAKPSTYYPILKVKPAKRYIDVFAD